MCAMVADVSGKSVLVTRYFRAIRPPAQVMDKNENASESVAWFVSLIPYLPRNALFPGLQVDYKISLEFCAGPKQTPRFRKSGQIANNS